MGTSYLRGGVDRTLDSDPIDEDAAKLMWLIEIYEIGY